MNVLTSCTNSFLASWWIIVKKNAKGSVWLSKSFGEEGRGGEETNLIKTEQNALLLINGKLREKSETKQYINNGDKAMHKY